MPLVAGFRQLVTPDWSPQHVVDFVEGIVRLEWVLKHYLDLASEPLVRSPIHGCDVFAAVEHAA